MDIAGFSRLPVLNGGRMKPLDTVARTSLLLLRGKQTVPFAGERPLSADEWLLDMLYKPKDADAYPVFEIDDPDVLGVMGLEQTTNRYYSFNDLHPHLQEIEKQAKQAEEMKSEERTRYQTAISNLQNRVVLYQKLQNTLQVAGSEKISDEIHQFKDYLAPLVAMHMKNAHPKVTPELLAFAQQAQGYEFMRDVAEFFSVPGPRGLSKMEWVSMGQGMLDTMTSVDLHPAVEGLRRDGRRLANLRRAGFKKALIEYRQWLETQVPDDVSHDRA